MYRYRVVYYIKHPQRRQPYVGDLTVEVARPVTSDERIREVKEEVGRRQQHMSAIPNVEWITLLTLELLISRP